MGFLRASIASVMLNVEGGSLRVTSRGGMLVLLCDGWMDWVLISQPWRLQHLFILAVITAKSNIYATKIFMKPNELNKIRTQKYL